MSGALKAGAFWLICVASGFMAGHSSGFPPDSLTFMDVGQGDCSVVQVDGDTLLIDVGPKTPTFDAGARIVVPKLRAMGVSHVDLILLSHPDEDHVGGLAAVRKAFPEARIAISASFRGFPAMEKVLDRDGLTDADVLWLGHDTPLKVGDATLSLECPDWSFDQPDNDGSMFIRLTNNYCSAVFSGDASSKEEAIEAPRMAWTAQVLKAGHHGSKSASSELWLETVHPAYDVISCGRNNPYGHPHQEVLDRLKADHIQVFRTDLQGDIRFVATDRGFEPVR